MVRTLRNLGAMQLLLTNSWAPLFSLPAILETNTEFGRQWVRSRAGPYQKPSRRKLRYHR